MAQAFGGDFVRRINNFNLDGCLLRFLLAPSHRLQRAAATEHRYRRIPQGGYEAEAHTHLKCWSGGAWEPLIFCNDFSQYSLFGFVFKAGVLPPP